MLSSHSVAFALLFVAPNFAGQAIAKPFGPPSDVVVSYPVVNTTAGQLRGVATATGTYFRFVCLSLQKEGLVRPGIVLLSRDHCQVECFPGIPIPVQKSKTDNHLHQIYLSIVLLASRELWCSKLLLLFFLSSHPRMLDLVWIPWGQ